jgi:hypothetical protein
LFKKGKTEEKSVEMNEQERERSSEPKKRKDPSEGDSISLVRYLRYPPYYKQVQ